MRLSRVSWLPPVAGRNLRPRTPRSARRSGLLMDAPTREPVRAKKIRVAFRIEVLGATRADDAIAPFIGDEPRDHLSHGGGEGEAVSTQAERAIISLDAVYRADHRIPIRRDIMRGCP